MSPDFEASRASAVTVALDLSSAVRGGGTTYVRELVPRLGSIPGIAIGPVLARADLDLSDVNAQKVIRTKRRSGALSRDWRRAVEDPSVDVLFVPTELGWAPRAKPSVFALRSPLYSPENCWEYSPRMRAFLWAKRQAAKACGRRATHYIAVSAYALSIGIRCLGINSEAASVVYHGSPPVTPRPGRIKEGSAKKLLFVSNFAGPYKNLHRLLQALVHVPGDWSLTVAGQFGRKAYMRQLASLINNFGLHDRVALLGHCAWGELKKLYQDCDALVWPSYAETFGHPLVEAHRFGLPIASADAASNREIAGDAAIYFLPFDAFSMSKAIDRVLGMKEPLGSLPRSYDWTICAIETANILKSVSTVASTH